MVENFIGMHHAHGLMMNDYTEPGLGRSLR